MKSRIFRNSFIFLAIILVFSFCSVSFLADTKVESANVKAEPLTFNDSKFEAEIRKIIKKQKGIIFNTDVSKIKVLKLPSKGITNIWTLPYFTSLEQLDLSNNRITTFYYISRLKNLKKVNIKGMKILKNDIEYLKKALPKCVFLYDLAKSTTAVSPSIKPSPKPTPTVKPVPKPKFILLDNDVSGSYKLTLNITGQEKTEYFITLEGQPDLGTFSNGVNFSGKYFVTDSITLEPLNSKIKLIGIPDTDISVKGKAYKSSHYGDIESGTFTMEKAKIADYDIRGKWLFTYTEKKVNISNDTFTFVFGGNPASNSVPSAIHTGYAQLGKQKEGDSSPFGKYVVSGINAEWSLYDKLNYVGEFIDADTMTGTLSEYKSHWASWKAVRIKE